LHDINRQCNTYRERKKKKAVEFFNIAAEVASKATCNRDKCGAIIVKENEIIGRGFNSPPREKE
jgi:dCMP deaminase